LPQSFFLWDNRLSGTSNLTINGNFEFGNGTIDLGINLNIGQDLNWISGHLNGSSPVFIAGSLNIIPSCCQWFTPNRYSQRGFTAASGSGQGSYTVLDAPGFITINGSFSIGSFFDIVGGTFTSNGTLTIASGITFFFRGHIFNNNGTCNLEAGSLLYIHDYLNNNGTINMGFNSTVRNGVELNNDGALNGSGTVTLDGSFNQSGTISPGLSPGIMYMNKLPGGTTNTYIELQGATTPGTDYDQIAVTGAGVADGVLDVSLLGGYIPDYGSEFVIMTCGGGCGGTYSSLNLPVIAPKIWAPIDMSNPNQIVLRVEAALPIELAEFKGAKIDERTNLLTWRTASESDNRGFEVQRSSNGTDWRPLGFVPGSGTSTSPQHYDFYDNDPAFGMNYYRLRQMDFDGNTSFSKSFRLP
jgi:hypothetical protein